MSEQQSKGGKMSQYCNRFLDDAPGVRGDCARRLQSGKPCEECPHRNIRQEVQDLRAALAKTSGAA